MSPIYVLLGQNKNLVEVKDDSISGGEVCIRVDYLAVAEWFADHHLIKQFDRTLCIAKWRQELCESELTWPSIPPKDLFPYQCKLSCTWWLADVCTWLWCTWRIKLSCTWLVPANWSIVRNHLLASFSPWRQINILNFLFAGAGGLWRCRPNGRF